MMPARHCPSSCSLHPFVPQVCPPAVIRWCAKEVPAAQPMAFVPAARQDTRLSEMCRTPLHTPQGLILVQSPSPDLPELQMLPVALGYRISPCSSWHPSPSAWASGQGSALLSSQVGTRMGMGARLAAVGAWRSGAPGRAPAWLATGRVWGGEQGLPSSARVDGGYPCFSGVLEPVFPCGFRLLLVSGLGGSGGSVCSLHPPLPWIWPHPTCKITPHHVWFCCPPPSLPQDPLAGQWVQACVVSPHPKQNPDPLSPC